VCMSPEFLRQGAAVQDTQSPDSVVIGELDERSGDTLEAFSNQVYAGQDVPVFRMNLESAELVKYGRNTFLAMNISYINEMARLAETISGVDIGQVVRGVGADWRINPAFLNAGCGYGGSCFPKDVKALISFARTRGVEPQLLEAVEEVNEQQAAHMVAIARQEMSGTLKGKKIALLGLSFKPGTDDMREAPSIEIINTLIDAGASINAFDPKSISVARSQLGDKVNFCEKNYDALNDADGLIIATEWNEFRHPDFEEIRKRLKDLVIFDGRNIYNGDKVRALGFTYYGIGVKQGK